MKTLIATMLFGLAAAVTVTANSPQDNKPPADEKKALVSLVGGYTIVSGEKDGKAIPDAEIKGAVVQFTGDTIVGTDKDKKEFFASEYTIDVSKTPWTITMKSKEPKVATAQGLIKKDGSTLTIIYALPGGETPKEFKTKENQHMFVLKNVPVEKEPNKFIPD